MHPMINLYCKLIIYTIERKKKNLMQMIICYPYLEKEGMVYLEKYDQLLFQKYQRLEKILKEENI